MGEKLMGTDMVCQVALVVKDIEAKAKAWAQLLGVQPPAWNLTDTADKSHISYLGGPTEARAKLAFFQLGPQVRLELIEPVGRPSTWGQFLDAHGEGIHHVAFYVKGMDEVLLKLEGVGLKAVQRGDYKGGRYAYVDGEAQLAAILELLENF